MAKKIEVLVLRNICKFDGEIVRKGNTAQLTGKEMERFLNIGAVERPAFKASDFEDTNEDSDAKIEGGDA